MTCPSPALDAVRAIHDLLYLDMDDGRSVYDPDKEWNVDMLSMIAEIIDACIPRPAGRQPADTVPQPVDPGDPAVTVTVQGGVADLAAKPSGIAVRIRDYDVDGEDGVRLSRDSDGRPCLVSEWPADAEVGPSSATQPAYRLWRCSTCGRTVSLSYEDLARVGTPLCSDCDEAMELL
jgi:hypothetical protein